MRLPRLSTRAWMMVLALLCALWIGAESSAIVRRQGVMLPNSILPVGRDFVVFYSAAKIITAGDGAELYDVERQQAEIDQVVGYDSFPLRFAYPAFFALLFVPLSALPYLWAFGLALAGMTATLVGAVLILRSVSLTVRRFPLLIVLALLAYQPVVSQLFSGLNVGLTLLCLSGAYAALMRKRNHAAGIWLGLLLFKPQIALPLLGLLAWRRQWRTVISTAVTGSVLTLVAAVFVSPIWPLRFAQLVLGSEYRMNERECCGRYHVSLLEGVAIWFPNLPGLKVLIAAIGVAAVVLTLRAWSSPDLFDDQFPFRFGLALGIALALSPHALFYETTLLIIPIVALVDSWVEGQDGIAESFRLSRKQKFLLVALLVGGMTWPLVRVIGVQPMALMPPVIAAICWLKLPCKHGPVRFLALPAPMTQ